jgi:dipeptidyl aminopeptidase/acylaminoacyl peptidase
LAALLLGSEISAQERQDAATIPAAVFARLPQISNASLSPDGLHFAALTPFEGKAHLVVHILDGTSKSIVIPPASELNFDWVEWANDNRLVFAMSYFARRDRVETTETRLIAIDRDGTNIRSIVLPATTREVGSRLPVVLSPAQVQDRVVDWLRNDPEHILLAVDTDFDTRMEVRRINVNDGKYVEIIAGSSGIQHWLVDQNSELRFGYGFRDKEQLFRLRKTDGAWVSGKFDDWPYGDFFPLAFANDPSVAFVRGSSDTGHAVIRELNLSTGEFSDAVFEKDDIDVDGLLLDPVTGFAAGVSYTEHLPRAYYFDEAMDLLQRSVNAVLSQTSNSIVSLSADRNRVFILASSDVEPGTYYLWDRTKKTLDTVGEVHPGLSGNNLSPVNPVRYLARDGQAIAAYLTVPRGATPENLPRVVMPHGGPQARDTQSFNFLVQFLASRGYAVFQPNFRGSTGYGKAFEQAGFKQWGRLMQDDVTDGAEWLVGQGIADPDRMCIVGWSYGGYSAAMGAVKTPDLFRCAASINGVLDLVRQISEDKEYIGGRKWTEHMGLSDEKAKEVSPYHRAEAIRVPLLIVQALDDSRVTREQGQRMARRLERLDKPVEYVEITQGGHALSNQSARLVLLNALEKFLAQNIASAD